MLWYSAKLHSVGANGNLDLSGRQHPGASAAVSADTESDVSSIYDSCFDRHASLEYYAYA